MVVAAILCGGKGKRLRPHTDKTPKPMLEINGKPILEHQIELLKKHGVRKVFFCSGYKNSIIEEYFGNGEKFGVEIIHSVENTPLGSAGALKLLSGKVTETLLLLNGDNISNIDLSALLETHKKLGKVVTVAGVQLKSPYGIMEMSSDETEVRKFEEKPFLPHWLNAGFVALEPAFFSELPDEGALEQLVLPKLAEEGKVAAYLHKGYWKGVDTVKDFEEVQKDMKELGL